MHAQARDVQRREEQERGAAVLQQQLEERHRQRLREEELRDQERQAMASELERLAVEEAAAAAAKRARAAALMEEVWSRTVWRGAARSGHILCGCGRVLRMYMGPAHTCTCAQRISIGCAHRPATPL